MKKYIIPAVELTAMRAEGVVATSFVVDSSTIVTSDGGEGDASGGIGQLTSGYGWSADDWSE